MVADERLRALGPPEGSQTQSWPNVGSGTLSSISFLRRWLQKGRPLPEASGETERTIRRYLLGGYPPGSEVSEAIDCAILAGTSQMLDVIENELIEEYVMGEMSDTDRFLFENLYLSSEKRLEKIRLSAVLLGRPEVVEGLGHRIASLRQAIKPASASDTSPVPGRPTGKAARVLFRFGAVLVKQLVVLAGPGVLIAALMWFFRSC